MKTLTGFRRRGWISGIAAGLFVIAPLMVRADRVWATGKIVDEAGKPVPGASIAAYDEARHIIDFAQTDEKGEYALTLPRAVLHLDPHHADFFTKVVSTCKRFADGPIKTAAAGAQAAAHALTASQAILPNPVAAVGAQGVDRTIGALTAPKGKKDLSDIEKAQREPGGLLLKVVAPSRADFVGVASAFWIQQEVPKEGNPTAGDLAAWLDPVQLMPTSSGKPSVLSPAGIQVTAPKLEPSLARHGQKVHISATVATPADPPVFLVVIARDSRTGQTWQLMPGANGVYGSDFTVDPKDPPNDHVISILAYPAETGKPERRPALEKDIEKSGLWDLKKAYACDPLMTSTRNRADLTLSIAPDAPAH